LERESIEAVAFLEKMKKVVKLREPVRMTQQGLGPSGQLLKAAEKSVLNNPMLNDFYKAITNSISEGMRSREALTIPSSKVNVRPAIRGSAAAAGTLLPASIREKDETSR
jgi:hypothetical protein